MAHQAILFCDEAGNTGPEYCNSDQPVFIAASFLVTADNLALCERIVAEHLVGLNAVRQSPVLELKSQTLLRSGSGRKRAAALLERLVEAGAEPVVSAIDKHFALGGRFVDDYLDLGDNPRAGPEFCTDIALRRAAATSIGELEIEVLRSIELAIRQPSVPNRRAAVKAVVDGLRRNGHTGLAHVAEGALLDLAGPEVSAMRSDFAFPDYVKSLTPNVAAFGAMLIGADALAREMKVARTKLVHDDTLEFADALRHAHWFQSSEEVHERMERVPYAMMYGRVVTIDPPLFVPSDSQPMVQAADVLAGAMVDFLKTFRREGSLDPAGWRFATLGMRLFTSERVPGSGLVFSDSSSWLSSLANGLDPELRDRMRDVLGVKV
jgi:hypothetical protein